MSDSLPPASYPSYSLGSIPRRVPTSDGLPMYRVTRLLVWLCHLATTLYELRVSVTRITDLNSLQVSEVRGPCGSCPKMTFNGL